jgi:hypothetical protein
MDERNSVYMMQNKKVMQSKKRIATKTFSYAVK